VGLGRRGAGQELLGGCSLLSVLINRLEGFERSPLLLASLLLAQALGVGSPHKVGNPFADRRRRSRSLFEFDPVLAGVGVDAVDE
jgi:hypothetical protein